MNEDFLILNSLSKSYASKVVINNLTLVNKNTRVGILGPNGAGKTSIFKMILGLVRPSSGSIYLKYQNYETRVVPENPILPNLSIKEWDELLKKTYGEPVNFDIYDDFSLAPNARILNLSAGQYRKASLAVLFYGRPKLLILDEPTNYLDINSRKHVIQLIYNRIMDSSINLIMASHRIEELKMLTNHVVLINNGVNIGEIDLLETKLTQIHISVVGENLEKHLQDYNLTYTVHKVLEKIEYTIPYTLGSLDVVLYLLHQGINIVALKFSDNFDNLVEGAYVE